MRSGKVRESLNLQGKIDDAIKGRTKPSIVPQSAIWVDSQFIKWVQNNRLTDSTINPESSPRSNAQNE